MTYRSYDGIVLPYDNCFVDVAFAIRVTHHITCEERGRFFKELHRVVRVGGTRRDLRTQPHNPLTRVAVTRCEFDVGVELLRRKAVERLLTEAGLLPIESR